MNKEEARKNVTEHYLNEAIESLDKYRRYWNGSISRTLVSTLKEMLEESGYEVYVRGLEPEQEHVFYLDFEDSKKVEKIAIKRYEADYDKRPI